MTVWQIWWIALAIKTILLPIIPVTPDEAYYFAWARHPALSYFDHPPFIAYIMKFSLPLWKTTVGIRWPGVIFSHLGFIPWFGILNKLKMSSKAQIYWILAILLAPLTGLGGFVITPDVPLVFFWGCAIWALLWTSESPNWKRWMVVGLACGFGLLSKYMMVLFFPAAIIWLFWEGRASEFKKPGPWIAAVIAVIVFLPVIIWNYQNHFASFAFQTHHGLSGTDHFKWNWPVEYLSTEFALLNPVFAFVGIWVVWHHRRENKLLTVFTVVPFVFFFLTSFRARVEANWPVAAYPSFMAILVTVVDRPIEFEKWGKWIRGGMRVSGVFCLLVISHTVHPWIPIPKDRDHTLITREWLPDVAAVKDFHPLFARSYQMAAFLSYYRPPEQEVFKLAGLDRKDFYDFVPEANPTTRGYIILKGDDKLPPAVTAKYEIENPHMLPSHHFIYDLIPRPPGSALGPNAVSQAASSPKLQ